MLTSHHAIGKYLMGLTTGNDIWVVYGIEQLASKIASNLEGVVHVMYKMFSAHCDDAENWL